MASKQGVSAELNFVTGRALGLVTNYGRGSLTDSVKVGSRGFSCGRTGIISFRRRRRPIQTRRPRVGEPADQLSGVEASTRLSGARPASGP